MSAAFGKSESATSAMPRASSQSPAATAIGTPCSAQTDGAP